MRGLGAEGGADGCVSPLLSSPLCPHDSTSTLVITELIFSLLYLKQINRQTFIEAGDINLAVCFYSSGGFSGEVLFTLH